MPQHPPQTHLPGHFPCTLDTDPSGKGHQVVVAQQSGVVRYSSLLPHQPASLTKEDDWTWPVLLEYTGGDQTELVKYLGVAW